MERVEVAAFCGLNKLMILSLSFNKLTSAPHLCPVKCSLEILDLEANKISSIDKNYLWGFKKLRNINLDMNEIIQLPDLHWVQHSLCRIRAMENSVISLDAFKTIGIFKHLYRIQMALNNIRIFNVTLLRHMPKLTTLELYTNKITHVDDFRRFYNKKINMMGNPWHCGAALSWMGEEDMEEFELDLRCATPVCLRGMAIADMSKPKKPCNLHALKSRQNGWHFSDEIYKFICFSENCCILIRITDFLAYGRVNNIIVWQREWGCEAGAGYKPLPETIALLMHTCHSASMRHIWACNALLCRWVP